MIQTVGVATEAPVLEGLDRPPARLLPDKPYVGTRPFDRHERAIFFGRDRDAALLGDKIFSARLTIVYGPSGVGKSSILRTLVVPRLEELDAFPVYVDAWCGADPAADLKACLAKEAAARLGIPGAGAAGRTLAEVVRLIDAGTDKTIVLVLDQFEEFFIRRHGRLDPLRRELGAVVRAPDLDVRVVLSLREEHLGSLEPFRAEVLNLFQSTYRLEPLGSERAREVIEAPALLFGAAYEPGLVDEILTSVTETRNPEPLPDGTEAARPEVDLPMLQLVCDELWKGLQLPEPRVSEENEKALQPSLVITKALYAARGGKDGILRAFLERVMPQRGSRQRLTAHLMSYLAPPDGHKVALSAGHIATLTGVGVQRVEAELQRLSGSDTRVLRSRSYGERVLYELQHDAFVRIIAPWRDRVLKRALLRRWALQIGGSMLGAALLVAGVLWLADARATSRNTSQVFQNPNLTPEQKLDHVASYLLWSKTGAARLETLKTILERETIPGDYGLDMSGVEFAVPPDTADEWPFTLHYGRARALNPFFFTHAWQGFAKYLNENWRIPVPLRLKLAPQDTFPKELVRFAGVGIEPLDLELPAHEAEAFIGEPGLSAHGQEFLQRFGGDWPVLPVARGGPWRVVPRWTLPVWKASGVKASDGSGAPAFMLAVKLLENPERILTRGAVELLLQDAARDYPDTVAEARAARGGRLPLDLAAIVKKGRALTDLPLLLDLLASRRESSSDSAADGVIADADAAAPSLPATLRGPHTAVGESQAVTTDDVPLAYRDAIRWLPRLEQPVRIYVGRDVDARWGARGKWNASVWNRLERVRDDVWRRYGVWPPMIDPRYDPDTTAVPAAAFRIEILNQRKEHGEAAPIETQPDAALDHLERALRFRVEGYRAHLLRAEGVKAQLSALPPGLRRWLESRYSLTDLKLLGRAVLMPRKTELDERAQAFGADRSGKPVPVPATSSVRHPEWLLGSLVFWSKTDGQYALAPLAADLRLTQGARASRVAAGTRSDVHALIAAGIDALSGDRIREAEESFAEAVRIDGRQARSSFLAVYPDRLSASILNTVTGACSSGNRTTLALSLRADLADLVETDVEQRLGKDAALNLRLCLLAGYPDAYVDERRALATEILKTFPNPTDWTPHDAAWFGRRLASNTDGITGDDPAERGFEWVKSAVPRLGRQQAWDTVDKIAGLCFGDGPFRKCRQRLPELARVTPGDPGVAAILAAWLAVSEVDEELKVAVTLAESAQRELRAGRLSGNERAWYSDLSDYSRAAALVRLAGARAHRDAAAVFSRLLNSPGVVGRARMELADIHFREHRLEQGNRIVDESAAGPNDLASFMGTRFLAALAAADADAVVRIAEQAHANVAKDPKSFGFVAALGLLLTQRGPWEHAARDFMATDSPYVPYIAMILYSRMTGKDRDEAQAVIENHWGRARRETWKARLAAGDATAWREMLIGYYVDQVERKDVITVLEDDDAFARSELRFVPLPRRGMLCEAYFYEALLAASKKDDAWMNASLEKVLGTEHRRYYEYAMARFLLRRPEK